MEALHIIAALDHLQAHAQFVVGHVVALPEGGYRIWYEAPLPDESHELRTERIRAD